MVLDAAGTIAAVGNIFRETPPGLFMIDPLTGTQALLSAGGFFKEPFGLAIDENGDYLIADRGSNTLFRVDRSTVLQR